MADERVLPCSSSIATCATDRRTPDAHTYNSLHSFPWNDSLDIPPATAKWNPSRGRPQAYTPHVNHLSRSLSWTVLCYCRALKCCSHSLSDPCPFALLPHFSFHFLSLVPDAYLLIVYVFLFRLPAYLRSQSMASRAYILARCDTAQPTPFRYSNP